MDYPDPTKGIKKFLDTSISSVSNYTDTKKVRVTETLEQVAEQEHNVHINE